MKPMHISENNVSYQPANKMFDHEIPYNIQI